MAREFNSRRQFYIQVVFIIAALALLGRAFQLQLLDTSYQDRARATTVDKYITYPSRGLIYDRNGKLLVYNTALYDLMVSYNQINRSMDTAKFCRLLGIDKEAFVKNIEKDWKNDKRFSKNVPFIFLSKIPPETFAKFQESLYEFPGFFPQVRNIRGYPQHNAANILGYISEVNQDQVDESEGQYEPGDYIGSSGLELAYENELCGGKGVQFQLKDNLGRVVGPYKNGSLDTNAISGKDLITSIDIDLQQYGEALMGPKRGSIVAIDPANGEILAMISSPTYDPARLTINANRGEAFSQLLTDPTKPLFDRTVQAQYPPGSIFKTVVGLIAMQEGAWSPDRGVACSGGYFYHGHLYGCHNHAYAGDISSAIQHSCNAYFITAFRSAIDRFSFYNPQKGLDSLDNYLYRFGMGNPLGIDFPSERKGNVPTSRFYDRVYPKKRGGWKSPTIMSVGIGQGEIELTSLQMANLAATIYNRGYYYVPHLVKGYKDKTLINAKYRQRHQTTVSPHYFDYVIEGMRRVILAGTGRNAYIPDIPVYGKTGTSQNPHGEDHSVFFAFAELNGKRIAISAYVENAGWGNDWAAPIASLMIEKYIRGNITRPYLEERVKGPIAGRAKRSASLIAQAAPGETPPADNNGQTQPALEDDGQ